MGTSRSRDDGAEITMIMNILNLDFLLVDSFRSVFGVEQGFSFIRWSGDRLLNEPRSVRARAEIGTH